jgi:transcriptional regulator with XRE-family HTH domain
MSAQESVSEDWAAVAVAINERLSGLGWLQRDLADRSGVSLATVREIQRHSTERRRSPRTLESLSSALGWPPGHLTAVLHGEAVSEPADRGRDNALSCLDRVERRLDDIAARLDALRADVATVIEHVRASR